MNISKQTALELIQFANVLAAEDPGNREAAALAIDLAVLAASHARNAEIALSREVSPSEERHDIRTRQAIRNLAGRIQGVLAVDIPNDPRSPIKLTLASGKTNDGVNVGYCIPEISY